jgi:hypothetical protein
MKTRKTFAVMVLAAFSLWIAAAALAQGTTSAPPKGTVTTTTVKPVAAKPAPAAAAATPATAAAKPATAAKGAKGKTKKEGDASAAKVGPRSIVGEVVDPACWIVNGAKGPTHKECAIACAKAGQVLGIVENKTQKFYMIANDKPGEDPNKGLIDYVGQIVLVKGRVYSRGGATGIKITSVEPYSATAAVAQ